MMMIGITDNQLLVSFYDSNQSIHSTELQVSTLVTLLKKILILNTCASSPLPLLSHIPGAALLGRFWLLHPTESSLVGKQSQGH